MKNMTIEDIAQVMHEMNKAICESAGDFSQIEWDAAAEWQKETAIKGVLFHLDNPDADSAASHEKWMADKLADGWKYGPVKDADKKEHPSLVPYEQLPQIEKTKDFIVRQTVHSLAKFLSR